ncbi:SDR family NAD(P)-dependent oxidoreductase [Paenibacillus sp.]|jgi:polyketide synthase PksN|uniref:type I polyketide synthase n=1 Tax=Paenibacillus sp. TaxID=58172 RepID=UPI0028282B13|nr:SDR family NAD(P)-dependent oxidoreductase [Paenibacillus sp.]MDR0268476.1 SDR family NAD(P)-dependent oxidoreductase [Paenibacillus sp.]
MTNNLKDMNKHIISLVQQGAMDESIAFDILKELNRKVERHTGVAIIGIALRLPGADSVDAYWNNLVNGVNSTVQISSRRLEGSEPYIRSRGGHSDNQPTDQYIKAGYISDIDSFDAAFFRIPLEEAKYIEPMQRMLLEMAHEAFEDAGYGGNRAIGTRTGVFIGSDMTYRQNLSIFNAEEILAVTGSWSGIIASRISYTYNLKGPALVVDTACSSGLVAVHKACESIRNGESSMALAGGVNLILMPNTKSGLEEVEAEDGILRAFDNRTKGTVWGEGVATVLLKPVEQAVKDGDHIYGVIRGSAINNDGASNSITTPSAEAQTDVIKRAWKGSGVDPSEISYVEAHGTGTLMGDPIEIKGITNAFKVYTQKKQFCGIGTVKTGIGHTVGVSGIASLIKVALSLKNGQLPPTLHFQEPNAYINFVDSPVYVHNELTPWQPDAGKKIAGISSFGFSGTNCHVVVEQAPEMDGQAAEEHAWPHLFVISAKNETALNRYIGDYIAYLNSKPPAALQNICYTAGVGRGHYAYRLAIVAHNVDELLHKLMIIHRFGWKSNEDKGIFCGKCTPQPVLKSGNANREATVSVGDRDRLLLEMGRRYIEGEQIDFFSIYRSEMCKVTRIPIYPLERSRIGFESGVPSRTKREEEVVHPLLEKLIFNSYKDVTYLTKFSVNKQWVLKEHKINDYFVLPGTAYLEMARKAGTYYWKEEMIELRDIRFLMPLFVNENGTKEVRTTVEKKEGYAEFSIASRGEKGESDDDYENDEWIIHVKGMIVPFTEKARAIDLTILEKFHGHEWEADLSKTAFYGLGPRWDNISSISYMDQEALIKLSLPMPYRDNSSHFGIHPALIDNGINGIVQGIIENSGGKLFVPSIYKSLKIYAAMPDKLFSYITNMRGIPGQDETITYDVLLFDETGQIVAEAVDYSIQMVQHVGRIFETQNAMLGMMNEIVWKNEDLAGLPQNILNKHVLIFNDGHGLGDKLSVLLKEAGYRVQIASRPPYDALPSTETEWGEWWRQRLPEQGPLTVLHMGSLLHGDDLDHGNTADRMERGAMTLFHLGKALIARRIQAQIFLISDHAAAVTPDDNVIQPPNAALFGMGKVLGQEYDGIQIRCIDVDDEINAEILLRELLSEEKLYHVAYRRKLRYVQQLQKISIQEKVGSHFEVKSEGVYILTGGAGGIGSETAKYLASKKEVNLALLGRSVLPERETWGKLTLENKDSKLTKKLNTIMELEAMGSSVVYIPVDVTDEESMTETISDLRNRFKHINGIVHAAGLAGEGLLENKSEQIFRDVMAPKVKGTQILYELVQKDQPDFFLLFSSSVTLLGGPGQADYTCANAFMEAFAGCGRTAGINMTAISWPAWRNIGMAKDYEFDQDDKLGAFQAVTSSDAIESLDFLLKSDRIPSHVYVGQINGQGALSRLFNVLPFHISGEIRRKINNGHEARHQNIRVTGRAEFSKTEYILANIWGAMFGLFEIDIHDSFMELGGNSLIAIKLEGEIEQQFGITVQDNDIISTFDTVSKLAACIDSQQGGNQVEQ